MGDRAIITTPNKELAIYVHWAGNANIIAGAMEFCKAVGYRSSKEDESYAFARLSQVLSNYTEGTLSVGVGTFDSMEFMAEWDNGVYIMDGWEIVGREQVKEECDTYDVTEICRAVCRMNHRTPSGQRLSDADMTELINKILTKYEW